MNFSEALNALKHGAKIRRKDWYDLKTCDVLANDWEEYDAN